jgi:hypothetical protein
MSVNGGASCNHCWVYPVPMESTMSEDKIRRIRDRAYELWEREGRVYGRDVEHWLKAERRLAEEEGGAHEAAPRRRGVRTPEQTPEGPREETLQRAEGEGMPPKPNES